MKAITILQPRASLIAYEEKLFETRSWSTNYRGPIAIHAGKKPVLPWFQHEVNKEVRLKIIETLAKHRSGVFQHLPLGAVVATAELVECWHLEEHWTPGENGRDLYLVNSHGDKKSWAQNCVNEMLFGDFTKGRYAWELASVKILVEPILARGKQGLWNWEGDADS